MPDASKNAEIARLFNMQNPNIAEISKAVSEPEDYVIKVVEAIFGKLALTSSTDKQIVDLYYKQDLDCAEIIERLGVTEEDISRATAKYCEVANARSRRAKSIDAHNSEHIRVAHDFYNGGQGGLS